MATRTPPREGLRGIEAAGVSRVMETGPGAATGNRLMLEIRDWRETEHVYSEKR